ncbi:MAG: hypothetical protein ACQ9MH_11325 [Nitrospinales bacterium]
MKHPLILAKVLLLSLGFSFPAIAGTLASESGKNWSIKLETRLAYDDNVIQAPTRSGLITIPPGGIDDQLFEWSAQARFKHVFTEKFSIKAAYDVDMTIHTDLSRYDLTTHIIGLRPRYKIAPLMNLEMSYKYIYNIVNGDNFSGIHYFEPSFNYMNKNTGLTRLFYTYKYSDNWLSDTRDTSQHSLGIKQYFFFSNFTKRISLGYKYAIDNSTGIFFDRDMHILEISGTTPLFYGIVMDIDGQFTFREYESRLATLGTEIRRNDTQNRAFVSFSKIIRKKLGFLQKLTAKLQYRHTFNNSNFFLREFRTNRVDAVLEARF